MGFLTGTVKVAKAVNKGFDKSTDWGANIGQGKVVKSTKSRAAALSDTNQCIGCGGKARKETSGVRHCAKSACVKAAAKKAIKDAKKNK